ncbi:MAG: hypothetical protein K6G56_06295 [Clostridiales bacterium]|nr:hypothetical protein [Clostridiales bacterium]
MTDKAELSLLLDYYGAFLTERQRELLRMSADEDMSLSEIAEEVGVSRQGVRDCLNKASRQLREFEAGLSLVEHDMKLRAVLSELESAGNDPDSLVKAVGSAEAVIRSLIR